MTDPRSTDPAAPDDPLVGRIEAYLGAMLRLWAANGWDAARGGHHERLGPDHRPIDLRYRRLTVCARQLFVYSRAARLGLLEGARDLAERSFCYLADRFGDRQHGGFCFTVDLDGAPLDNTRDLYGHAFALLGLAEYLTLSGSPHGRALLVETDRAIAGRFRLPSGWYAPRAAADWSSREQGLVQNPHMHLLEAYLAAATATGDATYRDSARDLIALMRTRLVDARSTIIEFRDEHGEPERARGHIVEPGHLFEWSWLLLEAARRLDEPACLAEAARLYERGLALGIDGQFAAVYDQVSVDGDVVADTKRIWPVTELIKARAARFSLTGKPAERADLRQAVEFLFAAYLLPDGGWRERLRRNLTCYDDALPATTCYHILVGLLEARAALTGAGHDAR